jgi:hypothetical protein
VVALYDFDPATIDWPFRRQKPLQLSIGQVIQVIHDDGSDWALGHLVGAPDLKGYFPKNYTVSVAEYHDMMRDYEENDGGRPPSEPEDMGPQEPPATSAIPQGPLPVPMTAEELGPMRLPSTGPWICRSWCTLESRSTRCWRPSLRTPRPST